MEFVKVFDTAVLTSNDVLKEIGHYNDCGADAVNIEYLDRKTRVTITAEDVHTFLACAAKYVDEHTLDSWTEQASMHGQMRRPGGRNVPGGHGADFKAGKDDPKSPKTRALDLIDGIDKLLENKKTDIRPLLADQIIGRLGILEKIIKEDL